MYLLPNDLFKFILQINSISIEHEQIELAEQILSYYDSQNILDGDNYLQNRHDLSILLTKALKYKTCINRLMEDNSFRDTYRNHQNGMKLYKQMPWIHSFITSIWMHKFH